MFEFTVVGMTSVLFVRFGFRFRFKQHAAAACCCSRCCFSSAKRCANRSLEIFVVVVFVCIRLPSGEDYDPFHRALWRLDRPHIGRLHRFRYFCHPVVALDMAPLLTPLVPVVLSLVPGSPLSSVQCLVFGPLCCLCCLCCPLYAFRFLALPIHLICLSLTAALRCPLLCGVAGKKHKKDKKEIRRQGKSKKVKDGPMEKAKNH